MGKRHNSTGRKRPSCCGIIFRCANPGILRIGEIMKVLRGILIIVGLILLPGCVYADQANTIVKVAQSQIGKGEQYGDNKGPIVKKFTRGKEVAWCAGFVSWTLRQSGKDKPYLLSARSYWTTYKSKRTKNPRPGDVIVFYRGTPGSGQGHVGIVEKIHGNKLTTIEGNRGPFPAKVRRFHYTLGHIPKLIGFVRI